MATMATMTTTTTTTAQAAATGMQAGVYGVWAHLDVAGAARPVAVVVTGEQGTWLLIAERDGRTHRVKRHSVTTPEEARRWMPGAAQTAAAWRAEATGGPVWPADAETAQAAAQEAARANAVLYRPQRPFSIWATD